MGIRTLKVFRIIVPGLLILILVVLLKQDDFNIIENINNILLNIQPGYGLYFLLVLILGTLYYLLKVRSILWTFFNRRIQNNIKEKLLRPFSEEYNEEQIADITSKGKIMNVFYQIIDKDESLREKSNNVRLNGLIWTSTMDAAIVCFCGVVFSWVVYFVQRNEYHSILAWWLLVVAIVAIVLTEIATRRHMSLSNEQLDMICQIHKDELKRRIDESL